MDFLLKLGKINQLSRNYFFGSKFSLFNQLDQPQKYDEFKEKISELDLLADDVNILFPQKAAHTVESFLLGELGSIIKVKGGVPSANGQFVSIRNNL